MVTLLAPVVVSVLLSTSASALMETVSPAVVALTVVASVPVDTLIPLSRASPVVTTSVPPVSSEALTSPTRAVTVMLLLPSSVSSVFWPRAVASIEIRSPLAVPVTMVDNVPVVIAIPLSVVLSAVMMSSVPPVRAVAFTSPVRAVTNAALMPRRVRMVLLSSAVASTVTASLAAVPVMVVAWSPVVMSMLLSLALLVVMSSVPSVRPEASTLPTRLVTTTLLLPSRLSTVLFSSEAVLIVIVSSVPVPVTEVAKAPVVMAMPLSPVLSAVVMSSVPPVRPSALMSATRRNTSILPVPARLMRSSSPKPV